MVSTGKPLYFSSSPITSDCASVAAAPPGITSRSDTRNSDIDWNGFRSSFVSGILSHAAMQTSCLRSPQVRS